MLLVLTDPVAALRLGHSDVEWHGGDVGRFVFVRNRVLQNVKYYEGGHCLQDNKTIEGGQECLQGTVPCACLPAHAPSWLDPHPRADNSSAADWADNMVDEM